MVRLQILSGGQAGLAYEASDFPLALGRAADGGIVLEDPGVWERHFQIARDFTEGFILEVIPPALVSVNGQPVARVILRNGDIITAGSVKMQFWLRETRQVSLRPREIATWISLLLLCALQAAIIWWLRVG